MDSFLQFLNDFRYEISMAAGVLLCAVLFVVIRVIFGPNKKKIAAKKAKKAKKAAENAGGSSLDDEDEEYKDHNIFSDKDDESESVYKDWD